MRFELSLGVLAALGYGVIFVFLLWLDAQDTGVPAWSIGIAFAKWAEEFGDDCVWFLFLLVVHSSCRHTKCLVKSSI